MAAEAKSDDVTTMFNNPSYCLQRRLAEGVTIDQAIERLTKGECTADLVAIPHRVDACAA